MEQLGRRERKKAQTRQALADAALELFDARGYDQVSVKDVADAADVSVTTLFKYFPSKEALVLDQDEDVEAALVASVRERGDRPIPQALCEHLRQRLAVHPVTAQMTAFGRVIERTPALQEYVSRMWLRHETALAQAIAAEAGVEPDDIRCAALARFGLEALQLARRYPDPAAMIDPIFDLLENGWPA